MKTLNDRIIDLAVERYNSRDYGSLQDAIKHFNVLDDDADERFDELLPLYIKMVADKEDLNNEN